jgi:hypothetical protein
MTHFDAVQASVALFVLQASPQPLQFFGSLVVLTSQPFAGFPSQSAVPATLQFETAHVPLVQTSTPVVIEHAWAQEPQLLVSLEVLISQPSAALLSQSEYPLLHEDTEQVDAAHVSEAFWVLQGVVHKPQWLESVAVLTHAELAPPPGGQSVGVPTLGHEAPQLVPSHEDFPFDGIAHVLHEVVPQELVDVLARQEAAAPVPQLWVPMGQTQFPPLQTIPPVHVLPQAPQFF